VTEKTLSLLSDPHPSCHIVFPYGAEEHLIDAVSLFTASGLKADEAVVLVTTGDHWRMLEQRLTAESFDVNDLEREGRLVIFDASGLLCRFFEADKLDADSFRRVVTEIIAVARTHSPSGKVRVYGEMVNVLCGHNNVDAAGHVEDLWNEVLEANGVPLLCSYSLQMLPAQTGGALPERIEGAHTHTIAA
jgi:hypothetical protein